MHIGSDPTTKSAKRTGTFGRGYVKLRIGRDVQLNDYAHIAAIKAVMIGVRVLIASRVCISDHDHGRYDNSAEASHSYSPPANRPLSFSPVVAGNDVWLGGGVCVLRGVTIARGAIIRANAIMSRDIPVHSFAVAIPARVVRRNDLDAGVWVKA